MDPQRQADRPFVPTTLQVGASLYDGLNPKATGASDMEDFVPRFVAQQRQAAASQRPPGRMLSIEDPFELRLDRRMRDAAIAWAWANPGRAVAIGGRQVPADVERLAQRAAAVRLWPMRLAVFFTYTPLLIFAIIGAWRTVGRGWPYILCWLPAVYLTLLHVVFVSSIRYREPAMLALLALAAERIGIRDCRD